MRVSNLLVPQLSEEEWYEYSLYGEILLERYNEVKVCFFLYLSIYLSVYRSIYLIIFNLNWTNWCRARILNLWDTWRLWYRLLLGLILKFVLRPSPALLLLSTLWKPLKVLCSRLLSIVIECGLRVVMNCYALIPCMMKESRCPMSTNYEPPPYEPLLYKPARDLPPSFLSWLSGDLNWLY